MSHYVTLRARSVMSEVPRFIPQDCRVHWRDFSAAAVEALRALEEHILHHDLTPVGKPRIQVLRGQLLNSTVAEATVAVLDPEAPVVEVPC